MPDYRDPKVTEPGQKKASGIGKWIGIVIAALVALFLLGWLIDWFSADEVEVEAVDPVTTQEPATLDEPASEAPAADDPPPLDETTSDVPPPLDGATTDDPPPLDETTTDEPATDTDPLVVD